FKKPLGGGEGKKRGKSKAKKGKKVKGRDNKEDEVSTDAEPEEGAEEDATSDSRDTENDGKDSDKNLEQNAKMENENATDDVMRMEGSEQKSEEERSPKSRTTKKKRSKKKFAERWGDFVQKIKNRFNSIKTKVVKLRKDIEYYTKLLEREETKRAFNFLWKYVKKLIKCLLPKNLYLKLTFSTGKPDTTGEALGVIAMLPMTYKNKWQVTPDFESEKAYADADFDARGHIFLFQVVWIVLRVVLDKDCRRLYNRLRRKESGKKHKRKRKNRKAQTEAA
ncbi:MAG: hypothetical protein LUI02_07560, partial [Clostridiales bacterium]|nr:hypothetical protein [Clostridiales bacterium]